MATAKGYVVVHPTYSRYRHNGGRYDGQARLDKVTLSKLTARRPAPSTLAPNDVIVQVEIEVPDDLFYRQDVKAVISVPSDPTAPVKVTSSEVKINQQGRAVNRGTRH